MTTTPGSSTKNMTKLTHKTTYISTPGHPQHKKMSQLQLVRSCHYHHIHTATPTKKLTFHHLHHYTNRSTITHSTTITTTTTIITPQTTTAPPPSHSHLLPYTLHITPPIHSTPGVTNRKTTCVSERWQGRGVSIWAIFYSSRRESPQGKASQWLFILDHLLFCRKCLVTTEKKKKS